LQDTLFEKTSGAQHDSPIKIEDESGNFSKFFLPIKGFFKGNFHFSLFRGDFYSKLFQGQYLFKGNFYSRLYQG